MNNENSETAFADNLAKPETNAPNTIGRATITYDYKTVEANEANVYEIIDYYEALGWELTNRHDSLSAISLNFKRNRKIKSKEQLNRLQLKLDDTINGIDVCEKRKTHNATFASIIIGIIGVLFFGGGMCLCLPDVFKPTPDFWMYIVGGILAATGAVICGLAYLAYKKIYAKDTITMNTLIDKKRDEISNICEDAQKLLA